MLGGRQNAHRRRVTVLALVALIQLLVAVNHLLGVAAPLDLNRLLSCESSINNLQKSSVLW